MSLVEVKTVPVIRGEYLIKIGQFGTIHAYLPSSNTFIVQLDRSIMVKDIRAQPWVISVVSLGNGTSKVSPIIYE